MAGFFGLFDYNKPGKGVDINAPEKRAPFRFLELLWRNLWRMTIINFQYFLCVLPLILAFHLFVFDPLVVYSGAEDGMAAAPLTMLFSVILRMPSWLLIAIGVISLLAQGPLTCGMTYMLRNFAREEHAWYSDFWQRALLNLKQGIFLGILDAVMVTVGVYNISLYFTASETLSTVMQAILVASMVVLLLYMAMRNTLYLMAVTVELTNIQLIRNAFILTFVGLPRHLLIGVLQLLVVALTLLVSGMVEIILLPTVAFSVLGFIATFISYPLIHKYLILPHLTAAEDAQTAALEQ